MHRSYLSVYTYIAILLSLTLFARSTSLYSSDDPLWELDASNFNEVIFDKNNAWIIEFYNNWCGHCVRFAPTWKEFARGIKTWRNIIDVAVVNCADSQNVKFCRDFGVSTYPTIKMFWLYANDTNKGEALMGNRDISAMEVSIINFLESHWNKGVPGSWPFIGPVMYSDVKSLTKAMPNNLNSVILLIEPPDSFTGRKVILDLSFQKNTLLGRVLATNVPFLNDLKTPINSSSLSVVKLYRNGTDESLFWFPKNVNETYIRDQIFEYVVGHPRNKADLDIFQPKKTSLVTVSDGSFVHMTDLENAVVYSLTQEVGVVKYIYGARFDALKSFLSVLSTYFPGTPPVMGYLSKLHFWVSEKKGNITGEEFVHGMNDLQSAYEFLPKLHPWVGCKGSEPKYRGYPCSLWTLFHTLTVQAEKMHEYMKEDAAEVLFVIKNYIKYFFTCEECAQNFEKMAENLENEVHTSQDAVLWLWEAHNKVNHRLAGDITEDPKHPKIQFPSSAMCQKCKIENDGSQNIDWDKGFVLKFLEHFYDKQNIQSSELSFEVKQRDPFSAGQSVNLDNSSMVISFKNVSFLEKWSFQWFTSTDISLCVSLYIVSALLLVFIFLLFRQRRRRKKNLAKYINFYP